MRKILTVVGARPQFVKLAPVSCALKRIPGLVEVVVHTGQHYDRELSALFFDELDLAEPRYSLGIGSGSHGAQTGRIIEAVEAVLVMERPDVVLVYGDTNSTLAAALAAAKLNIPVAHVEAGLRSFNRRMPEEINRVLTDHLSEFLFTPTIGARSNLLREGIRTDCIHLVGDVMYDAMLLFTPLAESRSGVLTRLELSGRAYALATVHRAENTDDPARLSVIVRGLVGVSRLMPVVLPLHPRTMAALSREGIGGGQTDSLRITPPVGFLDMLQLERHASVVITDSGGVQKEAFFHRVPCVTLRDETEWVELVTLGWNRLVSPLSVEGIVGAVQAAVGGLGRDGAPYGDGNAADETAALLADSSESSSVGSYAAGTELEPDSRS